MDQECKRVEVDVALGRDARLEDAASIADVLADWCNACEAVLNSVDQHIQRANHQKQKAIRHQQGIEQKVSVIILSKVHITIPKAKISSSNTMVDLILYSNYIVLIQIYNSKSSIKNSIIDQNSK